MIATPPAPSLAPGPAPARAPWPRPSLGWLMAALVAYALVAGWLSVNLPVFHHSDELYHFDYCLKLARGKSPRPTDPIEPDLVQYGLQVIPASTEAYLNQRLNAKQCRLILRARSYEAYHPPLFYWLGALLLKLGLPAGLGLGGGVLMLRLLCTAMAVASRGLLLLGLARFGRGVALAGLPYLAFMIPVDLLHVSNDAAEVMLAAAVFWLLVSPVSPGRSRRRALALGGLLLAAVAIKANALLYLLPTVALCLTVPGRDERFGRTDLGVILGPAALLALGMMGLNYFRSGDLTGTSHLATAAFPAATGFNAAQLIPAAETCLIWHQALLTIETYVGGLNGGKLYPLMHLISIVLLGRMVAVGIAAWGGSPERTHSLGWTRERLHLLRRTIWGGVASLLVMILIITLLLQLVGRANFLSIRLLLPLEFMVLLPASAGWAYLLAGPARWQRLARAGCWLGAAMFFGMATLPYVVLAMQSK